MGYAGYFIYFIKINNTIKIGHCIASKSHLLNRHQEALRWCPNACIVGIMITNDKTDEFLIHQKLQSENVSNEVFKASVKTFKLIHQVCSWELNKFYLEYPCLYPLTYPMTDYNSRPWKSKIPLLTWLNYFDLYMEKCYECEHFIRELYQGLDEYNDYNYDLELLEEKAETFFSQATDQIISLDHPFGCKAIKVNIDDTITTSYLFFDYSIHTFDDDYVFWYLHSPSRKELLELEEKERQEQLEREYNAEYFNVYNNNDTASWYDDVSDGYPSNRF